MTTGASRRSSRGGLRPTGPPALLAGARGSAPSSPAGPSRRWGARKAGPGLARFRLVETDPAYRARGLAGTLVHHVSEYGFGELGATTLVMVADPDYLAVRIYRSVGFDDTETQLQAERGPT